MSKAEDMDLMVSDYTEKSIKVEGAATRDYMPQWKSLKGRYNSRLKGGPGWIFSQTKREDLLQMVDDIRSGVIEPSDPLKSTTITLIDKISSNMKDLKPDDRREVFEHMKATFHFS